MCFPSRNQVRDVPQARSDASGHRRRDAESPVNLDEVVGEVAERNGCAMVLDFFGESVGQSGDSAITREISEGVGTNTGTGSFVDILTRCCATWLKSGSGDLFRFGVVAFFAGLFILPGWHVCLSGSRWREFKVAHYPGFHPAPQGLICQSACPPSF